MRLLIAVVGLTGLWTIAGCDELNPQPLPPAQAPGAVGNEPPSGTYAPSPSATESTPPAAQTPSTLQPGKQADPTTEKATAGVGKTSITGEGIIVTPVREYFLGKERIAFDIQIPHSMQLYKAMNNRYPRDFGEFDREILQPAAIGLPELPPDRKYIYDPQKGELLVGPADGK